MSDHNAQLLTINTEYSNVPIRRSKTVRKIHKSTIPDFIDKLISESWDSIFNSEDVNIMFNPYPTAFPYGNGMVLHFYQQQESSTTKTVHKVINKGLKTYV